MQLGVQCKDEKEDSALFMIEKLSSSLLSNETLLSMHLSDNSFSQEAMSRLKWLMSLYEPSDEPLKPRSLPKEAV